LQEIKTQGLDCKNSKCQGSKRKWPLTLTLFIFLTWKKKKNGCLYCIKIHATAWHSLVIKTTEGELAGGGEKGRKTRDWKGKSALDRREEKKKKKKRSGCRVASGFFKKKQRRRTNRRGSKRNRNKGSKTGEKLREKETENRKKTQAEPRENNRKQRGGTGKEATHRANTQTQIRKEKLAPSSVLHHKDWGTRGNRGVKRKREQTFVPLFLLKEIEEATEKRESRENTKKWRRKRDRNGEENRPANARASALSLGCTAPWPDGRTETEKKKKPSKEKKKTTNTQTKKEIKKARTRGVDEKQKQRGDTLASHHLRLWQHLN